MSDLKVGPPGSRASSADALAEARWGPAPLIEDHHLVCGTTGWPIVLASPMMDGAMSYTVTDLSTPDDLERFLTSSAGAPALLYKHSLTCGTSGVAFEEIRDALPSLPSGVRVGVVRVQPANAVSTLITERFGVRHESPQVLLIENNRVVWHASHWRVTAAGILAALEKLGLAAGSPGV